MTTLAWVLGRGGLLGAALERRLASCDTHLLTPSERFPWLDETRLFERITAQAERFAAAARAAPPGTARWEVYWAAGIGTMGSTVETLVAETRAFAHLLDVLAGSSLASMPGRVVLASSGGAIYAGSSDLPVTEDSAAAPTTPYAHAKLEQERLAAAFGRRIGGGVLIARLSTIYGAGQSDAKSQGLLTHISRCIVHDRPIRIFVPLDTIRDYIASDDAAALMVSAARALVDGAIVVKIIASEKATTIGAILAIFRRVARRPPRVVTSRTAAAKLYAPRLVFRSVVQPLRRPPPTSLVVGIADVLNFERSRRPTRTAGRP